MMRAARMMKRPPRAWRRMENSIEHNWLTDQAWLLERVDTGSERGAPTYKPVEYGPFAAKITAPVAQEDHQNDHEVLEGKRTLSIASDRRPKERQRIRIASPEPEKSGVYRVEATVNPRPAAWGGSPLYNVEVVKTEEY